jgi:hypothetical protein
MTSKKKLSDSAWFPHDIDSSSDIKMVALTGAFGGIGYAVFWRTIEILHNEPEHFIDLEGPAIVAIATQMQVPQERVTEILQACCTKSLGLLKLDEGRITSGRVFRNIEARKENIELKKQAAQTRWSGGKSAKKNDDAHAMHVHAPALQKHSKRNAKAMQVNYTRNADAMQNDAHNSTVHNILSEGERMLGNVPVSEQGAHATTERLFGAFVSAWPREVSEAEKKMVAEKFESVGPVGMVDYLDSLQANLEDWSAELTIESFLYLYDPDIRR